MSTAFGVLRAPHELIFGAGQRAVLGTVAAQLGQRALVCTDARFAETNEMAELRRILETAGIKVEVFSGTEPELPIAGVTECATNYANFNPDMIIGIGGGSCLDLAKLVSLLLRHGGTLSAYYGERNVPGPIIPVIAIPTTAGTGSEVTPVAVLADSDRDLKVGISSPYLIPHTAICDPELTVTCPKGLTAVAGADALTHAIEAFCAVSHQDTKEISHKRVFVGKNRISDYQALEAIRLISSALPRAVNDGTDLDARSDMMLGSVIAGLAFGVAGTAAAHAIQYPVGALTKTAHGLGVAALMPYVMRFNKASCTEAFAQIGRAMGVTEAPADAMADAAISKVSDLFASIGIPETLAQLGLDEARLDWVAEQALGAKRLIENNPRPLTPDGLKELVQAAFHGTTTQGS